MDRLSLYLITERCLFKGLWPHQLCSFSYWIALWRSRCFFSTLPHFVINWFCQVSSGAGLSSLDAVSPLKRGKLPQVWIHRQDFSLKAEPHGATRSECCCLRLLVKMCLQKRWFFLGLRDYNQFVFLETKFTSLRRHGVVILTIAVQLGQVTFFCLCGIYHDIDWLRSWAFWL